MRIKLRVGNCHYAKNYKSREEMEERSKRLNKRLARHEHEIAEHRALLAALEGKRNG